MAGSDVTSKDDGVTLRGVGLYPRKRVTLIHGDSGSREESGTRRDARRTGDRRVEGKKE